MKPLKYVIALIFMAFATASSGANSLDQSGYQTLPWRGFPIRISVVPGEEQIIHFGEAVRWSLPKNLMGRVTGESIAGTMYLTANAEFDNTRFHFQALDSNTMYLLDITANRDAVTRPIRVVDATGEQAVNQGTVKRTQKKPSGYVDLTRFVFQTIYSPERLIDELHDVTKIRLRREAPKKHLIPGANVTITPMAQWRTDSGLYAIGIFLKNNENRVVQIDPRRLRADPRWKTLSLLNGVLAPMNTVGDSTTMVVIADGNWMEVSQWLR